MRCVALSMCAAALAAALSCRQAGETGQPAVSEAVRGAPLVAQDAVLLLDDLDGEDVGWGDGSAHADNSRCHVCHMNYAVEELAVAHADAGVGCEDCHGASDDHCADEDNITPPDRIFGGPSVNRMCMTCHESLPDDHAPIIAGTAVKDRYCTDCHGSHRLEVRTRRWDSDTRALIEDDAVRMIRKE